MENKYSIELLQDLASDDLVYPKGSEHYNKLLIDTINAHKWNIDLEDGSAENDIHQDNLWYDCCAVINDLAQMVLDEREKRKKFLAEIRRDMSDIFSQLSDEKFEEYY